MNIFRKLLRFFAGKAPVPFGDLLADAAMFARAGFDSSNLALLKIDKISAKDPQTIYGLGVKFRCGGTYRVFIANNSGYGLVGRSGDNDDFNRQVASFIVTESGEKWVPGLWTWTQLPVDASVPAKSGRPMGCLPDATLFVAIGEEGWHLASANDHAFAVQLCVEDKVHSVRVWPGDGFAAKRIETNDVPYAISKVFGVPIRKLAYLELPDGRQP